MSKRECLDCGQGNGGIFPQCQECREKSCSINHSQGEALVGRGAHYNTSYAVICDGCGVVLQKRKKITGHTLRGQGVHPCQVSPMVVTHSHMSTGGKDNGQVSG